VLSSCAGAAATELRPMPEAPVAPPLPAKGTPPNTEWNLQQILHCALYRHVSVC